MRKLSIYFSAIILLGSSSSTVLAMQGDGSSELFSSTIIHPESDEAPAQVAGEDPTAPNWKKDGVDWEKEYVPNNDNFSIREAKVRTRKARPSLPYEWVEPSKEDQAFVDQRIPEKDVKENNELYDSQGVFNKHELLTQMKQRQALAHAEDAYRMMEDQEHQNEIRQKGKEKENFSESNYSKMPSLKKKTEETPPFINPDLLQEKMDSQTPSEGIVSSRRDMFENRVEKNSSVTGRITKKKVIPNPGNVASKRAYFENLGK